MHFHISGVFVNFYKYKLDFFISNEIPQIKIVVLKSVYLENADLETTFKTIRNKPEAISYLVLPLVF